MRIEGGNAPDMYSTTPSIKPFAQTVWGLHGLQLRRLLNDANGVQAYIEQRLRYGLDLATEDELLNGDGSEGDIRGLLLPDNHTAFVGTGLGKITPPDYLRRAKTPPGRAFAIRARSSSFRSTPRRSSWRVTTKAASSLR